ncbi:cyclase [Rhodococcus triatomae]|uniref:Ribosome association toxin PasT (RatA) of the RatAB toxin-antitoxin module n=1 Tax=Rhodococcus triatomae TaxID=300028 RepID=A0A1G8NFM8_9NOCA|nr:SRPBCC family protein [Rhodococcus triatomae]QNG19997.1 cyclase [Rhodococcus triatomae]QNG24088.1 cyclase [Rhodococcus triatomae]SDI79071.1 Ribosome association toxin PasT (RatA) of the RatAB toxin-antitoxin module [Rhodococcus triatomae]
MPVMIIEREIEHAHAHEVYERIADVESYPTVAASILQVQVTDRDGDRCTSHWDVAFRGGILRWVESDEFDRVNLRSTFEQVDGDLAAFRGSWSVQDLEPGVRITFTAEFDLGMPSLAAMLDPVAERALRANITELIDAFSSEQPSAGRLVAADSTGKGQ